jgi:hypothetical protein
MHSQSQRVGVLHAFDADLTRVEIEERWGVVLELGELICESTENGGRHVQVFMVFFR